MKLQFTSGAVVKESGVYSVQHYAHRLTHNVYISQGAIFPECKSCQHRVRFAPLLAPAGKIEEDVDFLLLTSAASASKNT
jgi:hypothetical protein